METAEATIERLLQLLSDVVDDFETSGCEGMGTVPISTINKLRNELGLSPLEM